MNINQKNNKIEGFEGEFLHPSLGIKDKILILGFRYISKSGDEKEVSLIAKDDTLELVQIKDFFEFNEKRYFLEKEEKKLARIEEKWSLRAMKDFVKNFNSGKTEIIPGPKEIYDEIKELTKKYLELEKEVDYSLLTVWCIGSYFFPIFSAYPFLNVKAPKRSGKSQCLNFLRQICFNAIKARPSLAALGDTVNSLKGVYLIDQADSLKRKGNEDLVDILADSYKKEGGKRRIVDFGKGKERRVLELETYSPKVFASVGELPEDLRDRCLIIPLIRSQKNFPEPNEENENWKEIRGKLYRFLIGNYSYIGATYNVRKVEYRGNPKIVGRELELWLPFEIMFEFCSKDEVEEARKRFKQLYGFTEYEPTEFEEGVVMSIMSSFESKAEAILSPKQISENMDAEIFSLQDSPKQRAAKVGWVIKKFNLSSEKRPRTKEGVSYLFKKGAVENIYKSYFKSSIEPTSSTPEAKNNINSDKNIENLVM